jgi:hypothetical protein
MCGKVRTFMLALTVALALCVTPAFARTAVFSTYGLGREINSRSCTSLAAPGVGALGLKVKDPATGHKIYRPIFAHKHMKFGTIVRFTSRRNGKTYTKLGICLDRGPYCGNREFDLGPAISRATKTNMTGVGRIKVEVVGKVPQKKWRTWVEGQPYQDRSGKWTK